MSQLELASIISPLERALERREQSLAIVERPDYSQAFRAFNGFTEGNSDWVVEIFARTMVLHDYRKHHTDTVSQEAIVQCVLQRWPWLNCVVIKKRLSDIHSERLGIVHYGAPAQVATSICEDKTQYSVNITLNRDCSFYLDTRNLRRWLTTHSKDCSVLNLFAYTGSLGIAALAGGAKRVVQVDRSEKFLSLARQSFALNRFGNERNHRIFAGDFFAVIARLKAAAGKDDAALFDRVILDPPFQSDTKLAKIDLERDTVRLINKVRPLIANDGILVVVNNALFLSGADFDASLDSVCKDGYVTRERMIEIDDQSLGFSLTEPSSSPWPEDPSPYNHPTKIALLRVRRR